MLNTKDVIKAVNDDLIKDIESTRCRRHGKRAKVKNVRKTSRGYDFKIEGCCDDLVNRAASLK